MRKPFPCGDGEGSWKDQMGLRDFFSGRSPEPAYDKALPQKLQLAMDYANNRHDEQALNAFKAGWEAEIEETLQEMKSIWEPLKEQNPKITIDHFWKVWSHIHETAREENGIAPSHPVGKFALAAMRMVEVFAWEELKNELLHR